ncbi:hypothetical protein TWF481_002640 [Arthrobotrys musiformis]|uniref:Uncharacterized protein n=1 Tax=Arthrobotrys musiformis TaxID=47236 RepID=A0AAV9VTP8_9PEZI
MVSASNAGIISDGNGSKCWFHSKEDLIEQTTVLEEKKDDFDKVVSFIKEGLGTMEQMGLSHEMQNHLEKLSASAKRYIHLLAIAAPFLMCDCDGSRNKSIARLYFDERRELAKVANNAYLTFLCRFKEKCDILDQPTNCNVLESDLCGGDDEIETFRVCMNWFGDLVRDITGIAPPKGYPK